MSPPPAEQFAARIFIGPALRAQPDRRLVDLVRDGYDAAFEEIVRRYRKPLDRFAAGIVGGRSEDVTQDSFSKALLALRGSEAEIELRPWLYRIVRNTALNDLRDRAPVAEELSERLPGARSTAAEVEAREELQDLMRRLQALPEPQRAALVMRELEGLSHEEIAAALGLSGGAARQAIYRARAALREGFGLLLPLPALRMFAEHGAEMVKTGAATVLIAGTVGAGVAIEHHRREQPGPEAAEAAPLFAGKQRGIAADETSAPSGTPSAVNHRGRSGAGDSSGHDSGHETGASLDSDTRSGPGPSGPDAGSHSGRGSDRSNDDSSSSGSDDRHGDSSGSDNGGSSGDISRDSGDGEDSFSSGEDSSGPGSGEIESESRSEPSLSESSDGDGSSDSSFESETSASGSGAEDSTSTSGTSTTTGESTGSP